MLVNPESFSGDLAEPIWEADIAPINGAKLNCDWIDGVELSQLESSLEYLSAGMLLGMFRELVWALQGLASIITAVADVRVPTGSRPGVLRGDRARLDLLAKLPRVIRRLSFRLAQGLPEEGLWDDWLELIGFGISTHAARYSCAT